MNILNNIKKFLKNKRTKKLIKHLKKDRRIYNYGDINGWGNSISFFSHWEDRRITGFKKPNVRDGDELRIPMKSGRITVCAIINVENCGHGEGDQFFADLLDIGYLDELQKMRSTIKRKIK